MAVRPCLPAGVKVSKVKEVQPPANAGHSPFRLKVRRASAGLGLFAEETIPAGSRIIEYVGTPLDEARYLVSRSSYLFDVGDGVWIDGAPRWNRARYINHSCAPNCEANIEDGRIYIDALRDIHPGEELAYNYGTDFFEAKIADRCRCPACAGRA